MRNKLTQPLWYHPTTVVLIDDDVKLLEALVTKVDANFPTTIFTNPQQALEHLKNHLLPLQELSESMVSELPPSEFQHLSTENIAIDLTPFHANIDKMIRFTKSVVVVIDRVMKEMDGLDVCRSIRKLGLPVKLILLTGQTEAKEALDAFNNRIIDAFIEKTADISMMMNEVNPQIRALAHQGFCDCSTQLLGIILNRFPLLNQEKFYEFFIKISQELNIIEYYILNSSCSYLLVTASGNARVLFVKTKTDFINAYDIASGDKESDIEVLNSLKNRTAFPFSEIENSYFSLHPKKWKERMIAMKKHEDLDLYYAVIDTSLKVFSFNHYIEDIWEPKVT